MPNKGEFKQHPYQILYAQKYFKIVLPKILGDLKEADGTHCPVIVYEVLLNVHLDAQRQQSNLVALSSLISSSLQFPLSDQKKNISIIVWYFTFKLIIYLCCNTDRIPIRIITEPISQKTKNQLFGEKF